MAPIRRYLRISKYSILECRIYLDNPGLVDTWLLNYRDPVLPRVFESVRPLVFSKLREEKERAKGKGKKANRGIKDVVVQDDFEVSLFLTDVSSRHSLLTKQKFFHEEGTASITGSARPTGTNDSPSVIDLGVVAPVTIREENSDIGVLDLESIPPAPDPRRSEVCDSGERLHIQTQRSNVRHGGKRGVKDLELEDAAAENSSESDVRPKRKRPNAGTAFTAGNAEGTGDDKKLSLRMSYDGFSIYGRILCLVIKRRSGVRARGASATSGGGQAMMEDWIVSTQNQQEGDAS